MSLEKSKELILQGRGRVDRTQGLIDQAATKADEVQVVEANIKETMTGIRRLLDDLYARSAEYGALAEAIKQETGEADSLILQGTAGVSDASAADMIGAVGNLKHQASYHSSVPDVLKGYVDSTLPILDSLQKEVDLCLRLSGKAATGIEDMSQARNDALEQITAYVDHLGS